MTTTTAFAFRRGSAARPLLLLASVALLALSGCAFRGEPSSGLGGGSRVGIDAWTRRELGPWLAAELADNPRFADASVQLVALRSGEVSADIDALTEQVRDELFDVLLATRGADVAWRPTARPDAHHRSLDEVDCAPRRPATHYVGLELRELASGEHRLSVRALDLASGSWVGGFARRWQGRLAEAEARAASAVRPDPSLRGLRALPFDAGEPDLATAYLANNLGCLLRDGAGERLRLHVRAPDGDAPAFFVAVSELVARYMNRYREVELAGSAEGADAVVDAQMVRIDDELWQVWMGVERLGGGPRPSGADTPAYVRIPTGASASRPDVPAAGFAAANPTPVPTAPVATVPAAVVPDRPTPRPLIERFDAIAAADPGSCAAGAPFATGERRLPPSASLGRRDCFALESSAPGAAALVLLVRTLEGDWFRLAHVGCTGGTYGTGDDAASPSGADSCLRHRYPRGTALRLVDRSGGARRGAETFHLVAAADAAGAHAIEAATRHLPDPRRSSSGSRASPLARLDAIADGGQGDIDRRVVRLGHRSGRGRRDGRRAPARNARQRRNRMVRMLASSGSTTSRAR